MQAILSNHKYGQTWSHMEITNNCVLYEVPQILVTRISGHKWKQRHSFSSVAAVLKVSSHWSRFCSANLEISRFCMINIWESKFCKQKNLILRFRTTNIVLSRFYRPKIKILNFFGSNIDISRICRPNIEISRFCMSDIKF